MANSYANFGHWTLDTDGNGTAYDLGSIVDANFTVHVYGTFGSGTVTIQSSLDNSTWVSIPDATSTAADVYNLSITTRYLRAVLSGSTAASLTVRLV